MGFKLLKSLLAQKAHDESKALQLCQSKVKAKKLPMEVIDAEYQWYDLILFSCAFYLLSVTGIAVN